MGHWKVFFGTPNMGLYRHQAKENILSFPSHPFCVYIFRVIPSDGGSCDFVFRKVRFQENMFTTREKKSCCLYYN